MVAGRKPAQGTPRHRVKPTHDWVDVPDVPFEGPWPVELPDSRTIITSEGPLENPLQPVTRGWWETLKRMPHCVLWTHSDWQFALTSAIVCDAAVLGIASAMTELRAREKVMGTTIEARMALRIRYIDPEGGVTAKPVKEVGTLATVTSL